MHCSDNVTFCSWVCGGSAQLCPWVTPLLGFVLFRGLRSPASLCFWVCGVFIHRPRLGPGFSGPPVRHLVIFLGFRRLHSQASLGRWVDECSIQRLRFVAGFARVRSPASSSPSTAASVSTTRASCRPTRCPARTPGFTACCRNRARSAVLSSSR